MNILFDTNILIQLEDNKIVKKSLTKLYNIANDHCNIFYHPDTIKDINKDNNENRRLITLSKLEKYNKMPNPATLDEVFNQKIGCRNENDRIDNIILFQIYKSYADLFITEDKGILKKAKKNDLKNKVLNITDALKVISNKYDITIPEHPVLKSGSVRDISDKIDDSFFDSLKKDYGKESFTKWFKSCAEKNRKCYYLLDKGENLNALLIYKSEEVKDHRLKDIFEPVLKICTFKVKTSLFGYKLGEVFLNLILKFCVDSDLPFCYVTTMKRQEHLINFLKKFGFNKLNEFENSLGKQESCFIKDLRKESNTKLNSYKMHPFFKINKERWIVPIKESFYRTLFKDSNLRVPELFDDQFEHEIEGNAIIKAYLSNTTVRNITKGALLFFYCSKTYKAIQPVGEVISHSLEHDIDKIWNTINKITVYKKSAVEKQLKNKGEIVVTIFRNVGYLSPYINYEKIKKFESFSNKFTTFTRVHDKDFKIIKTSLNENYIIN